MVMGFFSHTFISFATLFFKYSVQSPEIFIIYCPYPDYGRPVRWFLLYIIFVLVYKYMNQNNTDFKWIT